MKIQSKTSLSLRKFLLSALVAAPLATLPAPLWALPQTGGNVTSSSTTTTYQTNSPTNTVLSITDPVATRLVLRWTNFGSGLSDIPAGQTVIWNLPTSSSAVLNTVSTGGTLIDGALQSNGSIFIMNPNGIVLGNTATVTAAGLGLSTINEQDFFFVNNGNLSYTGSAAPTADVVIGTSTITVGTSGNVFVAGRNADVSGTINAGTLTISSASSFTTGVRLGQAGALTIGVLGVPETTTDPAIAGTGNLVVNTNGGPAVLSGAAATSIRGGNATITTGGGAITQGGGTFSVGDGVSNSNLVLNTGLGAVTLTGLSAPSTAPVTGRRNQVTLTTGVTSIAATNRIQLNAGTVTGTGAGVALAVSATGANAAASIDSGGDVTVTGGTISLTTTGTNNAIAFRGPGDLTFSTLSTAASTGSGVTLTSTTGAIVLPAATIGGNLTVTAQTNISQDAVGALANTTAVGTVSTRVATFDAVTGSITLTNAGNNFTRLVLKNAPSGATVTDTNTVILGNGTNVTGAAIINAGGNIQIGAGSGDAVRFNSTLALNVSAISGSIVVAPILTGAGTGYTSAPTIAIGAPAAGGTQATATASVDTNTGTVTGVTITNTGSGYAAAPTFTFSGGGGTTQATATGGVALISAPGILDLSDNTTVVGGLTMTAPGSIILDGSLGNAVGLNNSYGQINATAGGAIRLYESSTLNLGTITGASLRAYGIAGLINTGRLNIAGNSEFGAGTAAAPGDISLSYTAGAGAGNNLVGAISILNDFALLSNTAVNTASLFSLNSLGVVEPTIGTYLARNFTVVNENNTFINRIAGTAGNGITGDLTVTAVGTGSTAVIPPPAVPPPVPPVLSGSDIIFGTPAGYFAGTSESTQVNVAGRVILTTPDAVSAPNADSAITNVTVTAGGDVNFRSASNLTVNAALTQNAAGRTATFQSGNAIILGAINSDYTGTVRFISGNTRTITDSVAGLRIFGPARFNSASGITINRAGHSFGGVTLSTGSNGSATIVESGGLRLVDVNIAGSGSLTATSTTGDVLQDATFASGAAGIRIGNGNTAARATFNAPVGRVLLTDGGRNRIEVPINTTAGGDVVISQNRYNITLGNITTTGKLTVDKALSGVVSGLGTPTAGAGYTVSSQIPLTFSAPATPGGAPATGFATTNAAGAVTGVTLTSPGSGYTRVPTVAITEGANSSATVTATVAGNNGEITQWAGTRLNVFDTVTLRTQGTGEILVDNTGNRMGGIVATAGAGTLNATVVPITVAGTGYVQATTSVAVSAPNIAGGTPATATVTVDAVTGAITAVTVTNPGSGYTTAPTFTVTGANTAPATIGTVALTGVGNITLRENTTMNLKSVFTGGNLTATSEANSIIDSTDATIVSVLAPTLTNNVIVGGTAAFTAANGNITLGLNSSNYNVVGFTTGGNVSLVDGVGNTTLTTSTVGGTFDITNLTAAGTLGQIGSVQANGATTFNTNAGTGIISLGNTENRFGGLRFTGNTVAITENTTMNLRGGSIATGPAILNTNGDFITTGAGGSSFLGSLTINAPNGTIRPIANSLSVVGTFTVFSNVLKDLGALSKSANLFGNTPVNLGTGAYTPPVD